MHKLTNKKESSDSLSQTNPVALGGFGQGN